MKWIGQHIYDFISRFRNDVYLEDISTGTIASGGNLGLDSNNKIVKSANPAGTIDLTSEVTGVLPVANGGSGASSLTDNSILTGTGTSAITAEANMTFTGSVLTVSAGVNSFINSSGCVVQITDSGDNADGGILTLHGHRAGADAQDDDECGRIVFSGYDDGTPSTQNYAIIKTTIADASSGAEEGKLEIQVASHDGEMNSGLTMSSDDAEDEVDVRIGNEATSLTTIAGTLTMGTTAFVNNSGVVQVATQGTIDHDSLANFVANEHIDWTGDVSASSVIHTNNITDLHGAGVDGSAGELLSDDGDGTVTNNTNLVVSNTATTGKLLDITASALTTGHAIFINDDSYERASGHICLDIEDTHTTTINRGGNGLFKIDYTRTMPVASGQTVEAVAANIKMSDGETNVGTAVKTGLDINVTNTSNAGGVTNYGIVTTVGGADANYDIKMINYADDSEYTTLLCKTGGAFQIDTVSDDATGNVVINADGDITLNADAGTINLKDDTAVMGTFTTAGYAGNRKFTKTEYGTHFQTQGDILYLGTGSTTQGDLCYLKEDGSWGQADADGAATGDDADRDAMGMLAIALGDDPDVDGMLVRGVITMDYDLGDCGNPIYVSTTAGDMTSTAPSASGDFVRVLGYCLDDNNGQIWFNPDSAWVEIA